MCGPNGITKVLIRRRQKDQSQRRCEDGSRDQREREERRCDTADFQKEEGLQAKESRWHLEAGRSKERILP